MNYSPELLAKIEDSPFQNLPPEMLVEIGQHAKGYETFLNAAQTRHNFIMTKERREKMIAHAVKENNMKMLKYLGIDVKDDMIQKKIVAIAFKMDDPEFLRMLWIDTNNNHDLKKVWIIAEELNDQELLNLVKVKINEHDYKSHPYYTISKLKELLEEKGLSTEGTRDELIDRLSRYQVFVSANLDKGDYQEMLHNW